VRKIGPYEIEKTLGHGNMGMVYKGRHTVLGRYAAIKTLRPDLAADPQLRKRLAGEAKALAALPPHKNVVGVYELIDEKSGLFIALEFVDGKPLSEQLDDQPDGLMPLDKALPLAEQLLEALQHVHEHNVVHRDVKPANVMISNGQVKLNDFGLALLADEPRFTTSRYHVGTPLYMSPEQMETNDLDRRTDIYSAALVLYRMVAGQAALEATTRERRYSAPSLQAVVPEVPTAISLAVSIALEPDRERRYGSATEFRKALMAAADGLFPTPPDPAEDEPTEVMPQAPPPAPPRSRIWTAAIAAAIGALVILTVVSSHLATRPIVVSSDKRGTIVPPSPVEKPVKKPPPITKTTSREKDPKDPNKGGVIQFPPRPPFPPIQFLRDEIARAIERARFDLETLKDFDEALRDLDTVDANIKLAPHSFEPQSQQAADLRKRAKAGKAEHDRIEALTAAWNAEMETIKQMLQDDVSGRNDAYARNDVLVAKTSAEGLVKRLAENPDASAEIRKKAADLLEQALKVLRARLGVTIVTETQNKILNAVSAPAKKKP
jgi:serine/threonine protein kinase